MFQIQAPAPSLQTTTILPNPLLSDQEGLTSTVQSQRATDGTLYTYVKTKAGRRKLQWTFRLTRPKALELRAFVLSYHSSRIRITDHNNRVWVGYFLSNPFEFDTPSRSAPAIQAAQDFAAERQVITLEFEGVEQ